MSGVSSGAWWAYRIVVWMSVWPSCLDTTTGGTPLATA
jgi:hypothetical protein